MFKVGDFVSHKENPEEHSIGIILEISTLTALIKWQDEFRKKWTEIVEISDIE